MRQDQVALGSPAHVPELQCDAVLRQLPEPARDETRARERPSGHRIGGAGRAMAVLLPGRRVRRVLSRQRPLSAGIPVCPSVSSSAVDLAGPDPEAYVAVRQAGRSSARAGPAAASSRGGARSAGRRSPPSIEAAGERVQVVGVISGRRDERMIAVAHDHQITTGDRDRLIGASVAACRAAGCRIRHDR